MNPEPLPPRFRFAGYVVSRRRRQLVRGDEVIPLIPRYFDLLVLLIEQRHTAVARQDIFDRIWSDVVVSDGALSQAVRTIRRALDDDPREPRFIRTVSRHGYSFVFPDVVEEPDAEPSTPSLQPAPSDVEGPPASSLQAGSQPPTSSLDRFIAAARTDPAGDEARDLAERLHESDTSAAVSAIRSRPGHAHALAVLRDTRWAVAGAGHVPLVGDPEGLAAALVLIGLRARQAGRLAASRWSAAAAGGALAGIVAGLVGGAALVAAPGSTAPASALVVLAGLGALAGAAGGAGIGAGLAATEAVARSRRGLALVAGGALGGVAIGVLAHVVVRWTLEGLFGLTIATIGGPLDGLVVGGAAGVGYALTTRRRGGGLATPRGRARTRTVVTVALCCGAATLLLAAGGRPLVGGLIDSVARASQGSHLALAPLGRLVGDPDYGPRTRTFWGGFEGALLGAGLAFGLTRRPKTRFDG